MGWRLFGSRTDESVTPAAVLGNLTPAEMRELAGDRDAAIREALARRSDLSLGVVIVLSDDDKPAVRKAIAANPAVIKAPSAVNVLAADRDPGVVIALVGNEAVSDDVVEVIAASRRGIVRDAALRRLGRAGEEPVGGMGGQEDWEEEAITVTVEDPRNARSRR